VSNLLSEEYRNTLKKTHKSAGEKGWGNTANTKYFEVIKRLIEVNKADEILDYGAGWGGMKQKLAETNPDVVVHEYEPSRDDCCDPPAPCKFVICVDVLEHVEPDCLEEVLDDLERVITDTGYLTIFFEKAKRTLADGRNAHLIVKPFEWWLRKLSHRFYIRQARHINHRKVGGDFLVQNRDKYPR
jgi:2-polyprenyl-3-methyl-5-hydroxy-6-metoxy-1,4-benzoquinol methylase